MKCKSRGMLLGRCFAVIAMMAIAVVAQASEPEDLGVRIKRVALFKNGLGYFTSSATVASEAKAFRLGQLPVPSLGTFWVSYPREMKVRALVTSLDDVVEKEPAQNVAQLLAANPGRKVTLWTNSKDMPAVTGTILKVTPKAKQPEPPSPYRMDVRRADTRRYHPYQPDPLIVVKTEAGTVAVNANSVIRADFTGDDVNTAVSIELKQPRIRMELDAAAKGQTVDVSYLARGITWSPSYRIDISDSKTARFSAKALVVNEAADLERVHIDLVTGFPHIQFAEVNSPVAMSQNLQEFFQALTAGRSESQRRNSHMMQQQAIMSNAMAWADMTSPPMPGYSTAREGTAAEDLFLYPVDNITLARGETACMPLFQADVPYKHIYTWKIPDMLDEDERYSRNRNREGDEGRLADEVWHCCRLVNDMKMPWTTSPAEFIKDGQFAGQDTCYYTAPGAETTIRINRAMNVLAESVEFEVERKRNAGHFYGYNYDLVTVKGELRLHNRSGKNVDIEIKKNFSGVLQGSKPVAKDVPTAKGLKRVNPRHELVWNMKLEPEQKQTLEYQYEVYVRN
ncbi:MAG: DUF4139 domain-containing protein [Pirellulales bacterium]|nr:DUF4139 domain-containing protein [Pirellulales bacterium]